MASPQLSTTLVCRAAAHTLVLEEQNNRRARPTHAGSSSQGVREPWAVSSITEPRAVSSRHMAGWPSDSVEEKVQSNGSPNEADRGSGP